MHTMGNNLKATVRYHGAGFAGWQVQPGQRTVQGEIEGALSQIASQRITIHGAGRTDAGVHALGQVFSFHWPMPPDHERLRRSVSKMLGPEIRVESIEVVAADFHARYSAVSKRYAYVIALSREPDPLSAQYAWCVPWPVKVARVRELAQRMVGEHDFAGFQCSGASVQSTVRTLHAVEVLEGGVVAPFDAAGLWRIEFYGSGFLYKMVRNITSMLVDVARGKLPEERLDELLASRGPYRGHTAPAHGLTLVEVTY